MSVLELPPSAIAGPPPRRRIRALPWLAAGGFMLLLAPVVLFAGAGNPPCSASLATETPAGGGPVAVGRYAQPLRLRPATWYEVGATTYGGPADPSSGAYGSDGEYLPAHPDTFAELSVLDHNPAVNSGHFTFADGNALSNLPYMTGLRVVTGPGQAVLYKRDVGYGQGPRQTIANGQPYRLDVWWQSARGLAITKSPVRIELAPPTGAAGTLGELPIPATPNDAALACPPAGAGGAIPLPLVPGQQTTILPSGLAAAGQDAPAAVKAMIAAGNRLFGKPYLYGGGHGAPLDELQAAYDCSSSVSYALHAAGLLGPYAIDSGQLGSWGAPGPGRYVTVYANSGHVFIYVAGVYLDTVYSWPDPGPNNGQSGPRWRAYTAPPTWAAWQVRHPPGL